MRIERDGQREGPSGLEQRGAGRGEEGCVREHSVRCGGGVVATRLVLHWPAADDAPPRPAPAPGGGHRRGRRRHGRLGEVLREAAGNISDSAPIFPTITTKSGEQRSC